jgi:hypothetical protein
VALGEHEPTHVAGRDGSDIEPIALRDAAQEQPSNPLVIADRALGQAAFAVEVGTIDRQQSLDR